MGYKQSPALIVIVAALLLLTPLAYGQVASNVATGLFRGVLCCTRTGNCANGSPRLPGVKVNLNCTNLFTGVQTLVQGVTNSAGVYNIILPIIPGAPLNQRPITSVLRCNVIVNLPLNSTVCPIFSTVNGILTGVPTLVNTLLDVLLGPLYVFVFQVLRSVTITT